MLKQKLLKKNSFNSLNLIRDIVLGGKKTTKKIN